MVLRLLTFNLPTLEVYRQLPVVGKAVTIDLRNRLAPLFPRKYPVSSTAAARARLASLWLSQVARIVADNTLRIFVLLRIAAAGKTESDYAWHVVVALLMLPAVLLAPFNGALGNSLPKRWVLTGSAAYCCAIVVLFGLMDGPWVAGWALLAVGAAVYSPTRYALLPAAAADCKMPLTRVNGFIEMGIVTAVIAGLALGVDLENTLWLGLPAAATAAVGLNLLATVTALPVAFRADVRRSESAGDAIKGFFRDSRRIWWDRQARATLLALASLRAIVLGATGGFVAVMLNNTTVDLPTLINTSFAIMAWIMLGAAVGSLVAGMQRHPVRALGLVPLGGTVFAAGLMIAALGETGPAVCVTLGVMGGLINVPLAAAYQIYLPADARGNGMAIRNLFDCTLITITSAALFGLAKGFGLGGTGQLWLVSAVAAVGVLFAWIILHREAIEQMLEIVLLPFYRIKGRGPGMHTLPLRGPLLVVANHAAWFDPLWMAKVLPRSLRPMMTSIFYDLPGLRWLMRHVARAIRVQYSTFRREAPELQEAIQALDQGECVLIFPEGSLRKAEDRPLRHFGQGVWHILSERPHTPVVVCWIEGNWGSFFSYKNGKPTKNKRMDFWRRITIAVGEPRHLDAETLADLKITRACLEQWCREMRGVLGLEVPKPDGETSSAAEEEEAAQQ
ncbi:MAG TPA: MFS transporter [Gemmataceae bacterium]|nr:MFS transporter [Gemmataceae bacterium]